VNFKIHKIRLSTDLKKGVLEFFIKNRALYNFLYFSIKSNETIIL
jgi:hypothetical protein